MRTYGEEEDLTYCLLQVTEETLSAQNIAVL